MGATLGEKLKVAADFLEEHGFSGEVLAAMRRGLQIVQAPPPDPLNCFRVAVRDVPFSQMGEAFSLQVTFSPRMIEYGLMRSHDGKEPFSLTGQVRYMVEELRRDVEAAILEYLTKRGVR